jgi:hypothetical protein
MEAKATKDAFGSFNLDDFGLIPEGDLKPGGGKG